jgi:hypothetical protein
MSTAVPERTQLVDWLTFSCVVFYIGIFFVTGDRGKYRKESRKESRGREPTPQIDG